jgi:superfamily I DNA/RNA helicase
MEQAVLALDLAGEPAHFDAIVVDEAQDFSVGWWYALTQSLLAEPGGPLYAFLDPNQSLRGEVEWPPIKFDARFRLKVNCRNTRKIAATSASVLNLEPSIFGRAPAGVRPRLIRSTTPSQQKGLVLQELRKLLQREDVSPRQIALIGSAAKAKGCLADVAEIDGVLLVTSTDAWRDGEGVLVTTARSFKGLEADIVLLYDLDGFGRFFRREDLYVACTRARVVLIAVVHGQECRSVIDSALEASEAQL